MENISPNLEMAKWAHGKYQSYFHISSLAGKYIAKIMVGEEKYFDNNPFEMRKVERQIMLTLIGMVHRNKRFLSIAVEDNSWDISEMQNMNISNKDNNKNLEIFIVRLPDAIDVLKDDIESIELQYQKTDSQQVVTNVVNVRIAKGPVNNVSEFLAPEINWMIGCYCHCDDYKNLFEPNKLTTICDPEDPSKFAEVEMVPIKHEQS